MKLKIERVKEPAFPKLGWVAQYHPRQSEVLLISCGELVETGPDYVVEGVWPGTFRELDFDNSELFYGSGLRLREGRPHFVSSCSTVDRIWSHSDGDAVTVSNSLPCLLALARIDLVSDNANYAKAVETIVKGREYQKLFPVSRGELRVHYFENLALVDGKLLALSKAEHLNGFKDFESYASFLYNTAEQLGNNARDEGRENPLEIFSTISRGYDSPVASLLAKKAGAKRAFTIVSARSLLPRKDSGKELAELIGLECEEYRSGRKQFRDELCYWAANGSLQDMNFSIFNYPSGPSVMFTGFNGDMVWSRSKGGGPADFLKRKDSTGLGFCEHRLVKGVVHCPVPFWGVRLMPELKLISEGESMQLWSVGGDYDRPIPRRIIEEAGVPGAKFGQTKSATTVDEMLLIPVSRQLAMSYKEFLRSNHHNLTQFEVLYICRFAVNLWRSVLRERVLGFVSSKLKIGTGSRTFLCENFLFPWATEKLKMELMADKEWEDMPRETVISW